MSNTQKSILLAIIGFFFYASGDVCRKFLLYDFTVIELQTWAAFVSVVTMIVLSKYMGGIKSLKTITRPRVHLLRAITFFFMMISAAYALERLSLDVFYIIIFTSPFIITILASIFYKESFSKPKMVLIALGFVGVLLVVFDPNAASMDLIGVLFTLVLAISFAVNSLINKLYASDEPKFPFGFFPYLLGFILFFAMNGFQFVTMNAFQIVLVILAGTTSVFGSLALIHAFQIEKASVPAPYHYTQLIWGILFGYLIFGTIPNFFVILGGVIIVASGLFMYRYDNLQKK